LLGLSSDFAMSQSQLAPSAKASRHFRSGTLSPYWTCHPVLGAFVIFSLVSRMPSADPGI